MTRCKRLAEILGGCALLALIFAGGMVMGTMCYVGCAIYRAAH